MSKRKSSFLDLLGAEAGIYVPPPTLGDAAPPPSRNLRRTVGIVLVLAIVAAVVVVRTIPAAAHTWHVVAHQTDKALSRVLGKAEVETANLVGDLAGDTQQQP